MADTRLVGADGTSLTGLLEDDNTASLQVADPGARATLELVRQGLTGTTNELEATAVILGQVAQSLGVIANALVFGGGGGGGGGDPELPGHIEAGTATAVVHHLPALVASIVVPVGVSFRLGGVLAQGNRGGRWTLVVTPPVGPASTPATLQTCDTQRTIQWALQPGERPYYPSATLIRLYVEHGESTPQDFTGSITGAFIPAP